MELYGSEHWVQLWPVHRMTEAEGALIALLACRNVGHYWPMEGCELELITTPPLGDLLDASQLVEPCSN